MTEQTDPQDAEAAAPTESALEDAPESTVAEDAPESTVAEDAPAQRAFPAIGVCRNEKQDGADGLADNVASMTCLPLDEALACNWDSDAHFTAYTAVNQVVWPRCNKGVLPQFRAIGGELLTTALVVDVDNADHRPWGPGEYECFCNVLGTRVREGWARGWEWTWFYRTRGGVRFIYALRDPMPVDEAMPYLRGLVREFTEHLGRDYRVDQLFDWGRLFRLPRVMRDGRRTWEDPGYELVAQPTRLLDATTLTPIKMAKRDGPSGEVMELDIAMPDPALALEMLREPEGKGGGMVMTAWRKKVEHRLRGRKCHDALFKNADFAQEGQRYTTIWQYVGEACMVLHPITGSTPELVFALFVEPGLRIDPATCRQDPFETIWKAVIYCWAREEARALDASVQAATDAAGKRSAQEAVLAGMRRWCNARELHGEEDEALAWMSGRLIACAQNGSYVLRRSGFYDSTPVGMSLLPARIRELGMEPLMPLVKAEGEKFVDVSPQNLLNRHGTVVAEVQGVVGTDGTVIHGFDTERQVLHLRMFGLRKDLLPVYDAEVDEWLNALAGDAYTKLNDWLGHALAFLDGPICALSLAGPPGTGKGMLMQGLAECVDTQTYGDVKEFGSFQGMLARTPFLMVNEGFPRGIAGERDVADTFRALVDGSAININQKFTPLMTVRNPVRMIIAANNQDVVSILAGHRDLTAEDQQALAIRLFHIETDNRAQLYLRMKGGLMHTGRPGRRWVRGADGTPSDNIVAQHFMHLYVNRPAVPTGNRLLVEGRMDSEIVRKLSTRSGSAPEVIETVVSMIESKLPQVEGLHISDGRISLTSSGVADFYRNTLLSKTKRILSVQAVARTLASLEAVHSGNATIRKFPGPAGQDQIVRARWRELDPMRLLAEAVEYGYPCAKLMALAQSGAHLARPQQKATM